MMGNKSFVFRFADVEVREREFRLVKGGEVLSVEPKAFRVLLYLLHNPLKLIPKGELLDAVWGNTAVSENSLARSIALLRRLLGDDLHSPRYIETVATSDTDWYVRLRLSKTVRKILKRPPSQMIRAGLKLSAHQQMKRLPEPRRILRPRILRSRSTSRLPKRKQV